MSSSQRTLPLRRKILFSILTVVLFFLGFEGALRLIGFEFDARVDHMKFTFPADEYNENAPEPFLERDHDLFWKPRAGVLDHNSLGCYGPEFSVEKQPGVFRIVCIGDSCTHFGPLSYPDMLRAVLEKLAPGEYDVINAGVIGYSSHQGRVLLESKVLTWSPDLVTVYFGWNDHWLARGLEDKDQAANQPSAIATALGGLRLFQLGNMVKSERQTKDIAKMRVEKEDYRANLLRMGDLCQERGIETWYLTAPHALDISIPPYLYTSGEVLDPGGLIALHESYNSVVRDVGQQRNAVVIDLAAEMAQMNKQELFIDDHIHLSEQGRLYVAQRLAETVRERGFSKLNQTETPL